MAGRSPELIGSSEPAVRFARQLERAAASEATVLFTGESGTGKGLAARALHARSPRHAGPFVVADLAATAPTLMEAALFGHEEGAFTDARRSRRGYFRRAEGGTLVLDDIDLLPLELQAKLLRALQEREVEPLGAERAVPFDVRVVATTNRQLEAEVEAGRFRADLYYRLAVVTLELPPLRTRLDDLPDLVDHLVARSARRLRLAPRPLSAEALERLRRHPWPGNVRELENALERVLVLGAVDPAAPAQPGEPGEPGENGGARGSRAGTAEAIRAEELDFLDEVVRGVAGDIAALALSHGLTVDELTRALLDRALEEERGNVSAAARRVGLTRRAFDYRLARSGSEESQEAEA